MSDPYKGYCFRLAIEGLQVAAFSDATLPAETLDKLTALTRATTLVLAHGITYSLEIHDWYGSVSQTGGRKNISIVWVDDTAREKARWNIGNAWPTRYDATVVNASSNEAMIETLELKFETITKVK